MLLLTSGLGAIHRLPSAGLARRCFVQYGRAPDLAPLRCTGYRSRARRTPAAVGRSSGDREAFLTKFDGSVNHLTLRLVLRAVFLSTEPSGEKAVSGNVALAVYASCGFLIVVYAWGRSNAQPCKLGIILLAYLAM